MGQRTCEMVERGVNLCLALVLSWSAACHAFNFTVDWASASLSNSFPTYQFGVRKVEAFVYPPDGHTYAYADIVNYTCAGWTRDPSSCPPGEWYYPDSYSTEVGVFSSADGST